MGVLLGHWSTGLELKIGLWLHNFNGPDRVILVIVNKYDYRTLSPMSSFQSELGVQFGTSLEAPHVINVDSQVLTKLISIFEIWWSN